MAKLTENFRLQEFQSGDGANFPAAVLINLSKLAKNLQVLRYELKQSITITSGYRSPKHNRAVGGVENSQHVLGKASDLQAQNTTPKQLATLIEKLILERKMDQGGVGIYPDFVHYDIRGTKARWTK
jgi:uncharacterized protein YcbK (DUF882 family)